MGEASVPSEPEMPEEALVSSPPEDLDGQTSPQDPVSPGEEPATE
jgi:hypothetical protein